MTVAWVLPACSADSASFRSTHFATRHGLNIFKNLSQPFFQHPPGNPFIVVRPPDIRTRPHHLSAPSIPLVTHDQNCLPSSLPACTPSAPPQDGVVLNPLNPPPPPIYHSGATPATPAPFANLPPPTKHGFSSQRIVSMRDLGLACDVEDAQKSGRLFAKESEHGANGRPHSKSSLTLYAGEGWQNGGSLVEFGCCFIMVVRLRSRPSIWNQNSLARSRVSLDLSTLNAPVPSKIPRNPPYASALVIDKLATVC